MGVTVAVERGQDTGLKERIRIRADPPQSPDALVWCVRGIRHG